MIGRFGRHTNRQAGKVGLVSQRQRAMLAVFLDSYISGRNDVEQSTLTV